MTVTMIRYYINLETGSIYPASSLSYYERFQSGEYAYIGGMDCKCPSFHSEKIGKRKFQIFRYVYGKRVNYSIVDKKDIIKK